MGTCFFLLKASMTPAFPHLTTSPGGHHRKGAFFHRFLWTDFQDDLRGQNLGFYGYFIYSDRLQ